MDGLWDMVQRQFTLYNQSDSRNNQNNNDPNENIPQQIYPRAKIIIHELCKDHLLMKNASCLNS